MWGQNAPDLSDIEVDEDEVTRLYRRLNNAREHVWRRWQREYIHSLMEAHRINSGKQQISEIGEKSWWWGSRERQRGVDERQSCPPSERERWSGEGSDFVAQGKAYSTPPSTGVPSGNKKHTRRDCRDVAQTQVQSRTVERRNAAKGAEAKIRQIAADDN